MARLRVIEDDQCALSANPWEEELREREAEDEEEEEVDEEGVGGGGREEEQDASQPILPTKPSIGNTPTKPKTQTQKGLEPIFVKVDHQIALLDNHIRHIRIELLQTQRLVTAVKSTVSKDNQPEVSKRLEEDVFSNYLRIGDRLKRLAKDIIMVLPDEHRQANLARKVYKEPVYTDLGENSAPRATVLDSGVSEPSDSIHRRDESVSTIDVSSPYTGRHDYRDPHDEGRNYRTLKNRNRSDSLWSKTSHQPRSNNPTRGLSAGRRHSMKIRYFNAKREPYYSRDRRSVFSTNEFYPRIPRQRRFSEESKYKSPPPRPSATGRGREEQIARNIHRTPYDPRSDSGSSTYPVSIIYNNLTDSSDLDNYPHGASRIKTKNRSMQQKTVGYTQTKGELRSLTGLTSRNTGQRESGQISNVSEQRSNPVTEQSQMPPDESRIMERVPNSVQGLEIRNFLLEEPHDLQERIQALQLGQTSNNPEENGNEANSSISSIKRKVWSRLKSKFIHKIGHTEKKQH